MRKILFIFLCACALVSCREYQPSDDPSLRLRFSCDTLSFDTVLTEQGSATLQLMVYNPNKNALVIDRVWMDDGEAFKVNIDGEQDLSRLTELPVYGGDSLFVFVRIADFGALAENDVVRIQKFVNITVPQLKPTTFFVTIMLTINCFKVYDIVYMLAGGSNGVVNKSAIVLVYYIYEEAFRNWKLGRASASALVLFAIVLVVTLIQFRGEKNYAND